MNRQTINPQEQEVVTKSVDYGLLTLCDAAKIRRILTFTYEKITRRRINELSYLLTAGVFSSRTAVSNGNKALQRVVVSASRLPISGELTGMIA